MNTLPDDIGVYAVTATNATYYAYSVACDSVAFKKSQTCLGGLFSINWVNELQSGDRTEASMDMQFREARTAASKLCIPTQHGDLSIAKKGVIDFFGDNALNTKPMLNKRLRRSAQSLHAMPKHMMDYIILKNQLARLPEGSRESQSVAAELLRVETLIEHADQFIKYVSKARRTEYQANFPNPAHFR